MKDSKIEWCDHTFNPWIGCAKVSPGCEHCYAENLMDTRFGTVEWGPGKPRKRTAESTWKEPVQWNRLAEQEFFVEVTRERRTVARGDARELAKDGTIEAGDGVRCVRPRVFCASLADWLDMEVPIAWLVDLLDLIRITPHLDWLLLTKRPQHWHERVQEASWAPETNPQTFKWIINWLCSRAPINVWMGTTAENQHFANIRTKELLRIPAKVRFLSCEPMLGPIDLTDLSFVFGSGYNALNPYQQFGSLSPQEPKLDWIICGGESGPEARPMHPNWARALRIQCAKTGTPFLFKQWGEHVDIKNMPEATLAAQKGLQPIFFDGHEDAVYHVGKRGAGRTLDGKVHDGYPEVAP